MSLGLSLSLLPSSGCSWFGPLLHSAKRSDIGYLINRAADAGGRSKAVYWIAVVLVSVLFGYGHYYKGPAGVVDSGMAGLVLGAAYVLSGRNLWVCVLAHGFIDTIGLIAVFFGWSS